MIKRNLKELSLPDPVPIAEITGLWIGTGASIFLRRLAEATELGAEIIPGAGKIHRAFATKWAEYLADRYPTKPYENLSKDEKLKAWGDFQTLFEAARLTNRSIDAYMLVKLILESKQEALAETVRRFDADRKLAGAEILDPSQMAMWSLLPDWIILGLLNDTPHSEVNLRIVEGKIAIYLQYFYPDDPVFKNPNQELARIALDVDKVISASRVLKRELESEPKENEEKRQFTPSTVLDPSSKEAEEWALTYLGDPTFIQTLINYQNAGTLGEYGRYMKVAEWILQQVEEIIQLNENRLVELWENLSNSYPDKPNFPEYPLTPTKMIEAFPADRLLDTTYMNPVEVYVTILEVIAIQCPSVYPLIMRYLNTFSRDGVHQ